MAGDAKLLALNPIDSASKEFALRRRPLTVGSVESNDIVLRDSSVSRSHARLDWRDGQFWLTDLKSTNGSFIGGQPVTGAPQVLHSGDQLRFGAVRFVFTGEQPPARVAPTDVAATAPRAQRARSTERRRPSFRAIAELMLLAFVAGFGAAQYLAYRMYSAENRLILAKAEPLPQSNAPPTAPPASPPPSAATQPPRHAAPSVAATGSAPEMAKVPNNSSQDQNEFAGAIALTRLFQQSATQAGRPAADFSLPDLAGTPVSLQSLRGKIIFLNFWATWCSSCRSELPSLERMYKDFADRNQFAVVTISLDQHNTGGLPSFLRSNGCDFPVLLDADGEVEKQYGVRGIPATFLIGRSGTVLWNIEGALNWSDKNVRQALKLMLAPPVTAIAN